MKAMLKTSVKNGTYMTLTDAAAESGMTIGQLLDILVSALEDGRISIMERQIVPNLNGLPIEERFANGLIDAMREKGYTDEDIKHNFDGMAKMIRETGICTVTLS